MESDLVISVENLGKKYSLGHQKRERYTALRDVLVVRARASWARMSRALRTPPNVSGLSVQAGIQSNSEITNEEFWALREVSFEIKRGQVVGIIGRNGAGKSTLLKILSRITEPTVGRVRVRGRIASLLEVGTGFHPELTGRENIYLNGAILGMSRAEVRGKFDEIVSFAEVEKFLDTPVKRYSSGMYVRLAFAVAAHLDPEILVIDEVLAVGDAEFQRKCLGKMNDVARGGRTVLFVSHNMTAVKSLTSHGVVLNSGRVSFNGLSEAAIAHYRDLVITPKSNDNLQFIGKGAHTAILFARLLDGSGHAVSSYVPGQALLMEVTFSTDGKAGLSLELILADSARNKIALTSWHQFHGFTLPSKSGVYKALMEIEPLWLATGSYSFDIATSVVNIGWDHMLEEVISFDVLYSNPLGLSWDFKQAYGIGSLAMLLKDKPVVQTVKLE